MSEAAKPDQPPGPGSEHKVFEKDLGTWSAAISITPTPGAPVQLSTGHIHNRLTAGGLWMVSDFKNETTGFDGHGQYGFDKIRGKYVATWVDPTRTFLAVGEGAWDAAEKTMTFVFEVTPAPGKTMRWREITRTENADTQVYRIMMPGADGKEFEMMHVTYKRK